MDNVGLDAATTGACSIALSAKVALLDLRPHSQGLDADDEAPFLRAEAAHACAVNLLVEGVHVLEHGPVALQELEVSVGRDNIDVILDVLDGAMDEAESHPLS